VLPSTLQALVILFLALMPGAFYIWTFERQVGPWSVGLPDRLPRFIGASTVFHVVMAPVSYWIWKHYFSDEQCEHGNPWLLWAAAAWVIVCPGLLGSFAGRGVRLRQSWAMGSVGPAPTPRAWDAFFLDNPIGWIVLRLKSGSWIGGELAEYSYASAGFESPDLYISSAAEVDPDTGQFQVDDDGNVLLRESGLLVRWDEVEYFEFIPGVRK